MIIWGRNNSEVVQISLTEKYGVCKFKYNTGRRVGHGGTDLQFQNLGGWASRPT